MSSIYDDSLYVVGTQVELDKIKPNEYKKSVSGIIFAAFVPPSPRQRLGLMQLKGEIQLSDKCKEDKLIVLTQPQASKLQPPYVNVPNEIITALEAANPGSKIGIEQMFNEFEVME